MANCNYKVNLTDIQNKYKFKIFNTGSYNDSDLRKMIESVFYALPRTTGSGTSVTLTDTAFSYMKNKLYATDTTQETTLGTNYFNASAIANSNIVVSNEGQTITMPIITSGNGITPTNKALKDLCPTLQVGDTVYLKFDRSATGYNQIIYLDSPSSYVWLNSSSKTITQNDLNSAVSLYGNRYSDGETNQVILSNFRIIKNSTDAWEKFSYGASPNPDYPQTIHTTTGNNNILVRSKNLFNKNDVENDKRLDGSGQPITSSATGFSLTGYIKVKPNTQYTYSRNLTSSTYYVNICEYTKDKTFIERLYKAGESTTTYTFTTPSNCEYLRINDATTNLDNIQLELGDTATSYKPYQTNAVLLTLGDTEICKIENYEDKIFKAIKGNEVYDSLASEEKATLDYGKWYLRKNIGKVVLDGSETYSLSAGNRFTLLKDINMLAVSIALTGYLYSNYYEEYSSTDLDNYNYGITRFYATGSYNYEKLVLKNSDYNDANNFKTWLSTHNTTVYYILATPTNIKFNDTIQDQLEDIYNNMLSYEGTTNISQENADLPFNIEATAIKDLNSL